MGWLDLIKDHLANAKAKKFRETFRIAFPDTCWILYPQKSLKNMQSQTFRTVVQAEMIF
jgi:hypothetical protein